MSREIPTILELIDALTYKGITRVTGVKSPIAMRHWHYRGRIPPQHLYPIYKSILRNKIKIRGRVPTCLEFLQIAICPPRKRETDIKLKPGRKTR